MIAVPYTAHGVIPAPFVTVDLRDPGSTHELSGAPALVDSGCDRAVIPAGWVALLQLPPEKSILVAGLGGHVQTVSTYLVRLRIGDLAWHDIEVAAHDGEEYVLLGRDVLNRHRVVLDGPSLTLEIS